MSTPASERADEVQETTLTTIQMALARTRARIKAIKTGKVSEAKGTLAEFSQVRKDLLLHYTNLHAQAFNDLNESPAVQTAIDALDNQSVSARTETKKIKKLTSGINKFTAVVNRITGIVTGLAAL